MLGLHLVILYQTARTRSEQDPNKTSLMPKPPCPRFKHNHPSALAPRRPRDGPAEMTRIGITSMKEGTARTELAEAVYRSIYIAHSIRLEMSAHYAQFSPSERNHVRVDRYHANSKQTQKHKNQKNLGNHKTVSTDPQLVLCDLCSAPPLPPLLPLLPPPPVLPPL